MAGEETPYDVSPAALEPLLKHTWSQLGWLEANVRKGTGPYASMTSGLLFGEPRTLDHDGWVAAAQAAASAVTLPDVSDAFVASLTTKRMDLRSALGSYAVARILPEHSFALRPHGPFCGVCDLYGRPEPEDLNVLNQERFLYGGVRRLDLPYITLDLELFRRAPKEPVTDAAVRLGRDLLAALSDAPPTATVPQMASSLKLLGGNKAQRTVLLEILGVCSVLVDPAHPGFATSFVSATEREEAPGHWTQTSYPASWWRGRNSINHEALRLFLPSLI